MANLLPTTQVDTTQSLLDPNSADLQTLNRQQQYAQALMNQGMTNQPQGQMVGGWYVKPSALQQLTPLAQALTGGYLGNKAEESQRNLAAAIRGKQAEAVQNYSNAKTPQERFAAGTNPYAPAELQKQAYSMIAPQKLGEGETISQLNFGSGKYEPLASGGEKLPTEYKEYQKAAEGGFKGTFFDYQQALKRAGASNVSVRTGNSLAEQIGPMMKESAAQTVGAMKVKDAADQILNSLKTGNVISGTGANVRIPMARLANMIGAGGNNDVEKLANTQTMVQNLAKLTLAGRQQMHGEGAITNSESNIAEKAMSGNAELSPTEIAQLANAAKRSAAYQNQLHNQKLQVMSQNPETRALAPYFQVSPMNSDNSTTSTQNNVVDYNSLK